VSSIPRNTNASMTQEPQSVKNVRDQYLLAYGTIQNLKKRRGFASTVLTGPGGIAAPLQVSQVSRTTLGS
jgi:hypothetical protein